MPDRPCRPALPSPRRRPGSSLTVRSSLAVAGRRPSGVSDRQTRACGREGRLVRGRPASAVCSSSWPCSPGTGCRTGSGSRGAAASTDPSGLKRSARASNPRRTTSCRPVAASHNRTVRSALGGQQAAVGPTGDGKRRPIVLALQIAGGASASTRPTVPSSPCRIPFPAGSHTARFRGRRPPPGTSASRPGEFGQARSASRSARSCQQGAVGLKQPRERSPVPPCASYP
jgi:hypothetical protein